MKISHFLYKSGVVMGTKDATGSLKERMILLSESTGRVIQHSNITPGGVLLALLTSFASLPRNLRRTAARLLEN